MMRVTGLLLAIVAAVVFGWYISQPEDDVSNRALLDACRLTDYNCGVFLQPPELRFTNMTEMLNAWGFYIYTDKVYLEMGLDPEESHIGYMVLVHETVHYLQNKYDAAAPSKLRSCLHEEEAWNVTNALALELKRPDLLREDWAKGYGCVKNRWYNWGDVQRWVD